GHTDSVGDASYNQRLSEQRAATVASYLSTRGVMRDRMITIGAGETRPIARNDTESGRAQNRRGEIALVPLSRWRGPCARPPGAHNSKGPRKRPFAVPKDGGGGGNRTRVRRHSISGTTCLARCSFSDGGNTTCEAHRHPHRLWFRQR